MLNNDWKDSSWDNIRSLRTGLDGDHRGIRHNVFGDNVIDIEEKSTFQILIDEVGAIASPVWFRNSELNICPFCHSGIPPFLRVPDSELDPLVTG